MRLADATDQMRDRRWRTRSSERLPDTVWQSTIARVRSEFEEMPCLRVTPDQARMLFGLTGTTSDWILGRLAAEGFLVQTPDGQYLRRNPTP